MSLFVSRYLSAFADKSRMTSPETFTINARDSTPQTGDLNSPSHESCLASLLSRNSNYIQ